MAKENFQDRLLIRLRIWWPWLAVIFTIFLLGYTLLWGDSSLKQVLSLRDERNKLQTEIKLLQTQKDELEHQLIRLEKKDSTVLEEVARWKGFAHEGETVYRVQYVKDSTDVD